MSARIGTATTGAWTTNTAFNAVDITTITYGGREATVADSSHLGTTGTRTKLIGDLTEPGTIQIEGWADFDIDWTVGSGSTDTFTITYNKLAGESTAANDACTASIISVEETVPLEDICGVSITLQIEGAVTRTAST